MSANAELAATAIAQYLADCGVVAVGDQIAAIRRSYALTWQHNLWLTGVGRELTTNDIAAGIDLLLSRLVDEAQVSYDRQEAA